MIHCSGGKKKTKCNKCNEDDCDEQKQFTYIQHIKNKTKIIVVICRHEERNNQEVSSAPEEYEENQICTHCFEKAKNSTIRASTK